MNLNKLAILSVIGVFIISMVGCGKKVSLTITDDCAEYELRESEEFDCMELVNGDKIYRPFSPAEPAMAKEVVGYYYGDGDDQPNYVLSVDDLSTDEWLIDVANTGTDKKVNGHNIGSLYKEITVTDVPDGFEAESSYEWNK